MRIITVDFESYYDDDYTLRKLTTEEYVRDPRFETLCCAVCERDSFGRDLSVCQPGDRMSDQVEKWKRDQQNGDVIAMLAHHAHFDGLILSHHYDFKPDIWLDTLSMGRYLFNGLPNSLGALAERLGLGEKTVPYDLFKGKHWHDLGVLTQQQVMNGAVQDGQLTRKAFGIMVQGNYPAVPYAFPMSELPIISLTVKMFTEPVLVGDVQALGEAWHAEQEILQGLFDRYGFGGLSKATIEQMLRNDDVFADLLVSLDVEPEMKITPSGNPKYAFAKTDRFMQDLLADWSDEVSLLAETRQKASSSIYKSRIERYGEMALRGAMCVYLAYAAAHTRRWGGGDKTNFQNLPRPDKYRPQKGALRRAIKAPA